MESGHGHVEVGEALLALTEGARRGRGPSGVLAVLATTAERLLGMGAGAATGGPDGVDAGSVMLSDGAEGDIVTAAFEDGPGGDCVRSGRSVACDDVSVAGPRWLRFAAKASSAGVGGAWALPVRRDDESMGALLLVDGSGRGRPDLALAASLAEAAAVGLRHAHALHQAETVGEQLREALHSRVVIEQAKGALALHTGLDVEEAFVALRGHARRRGLRLTDLARGVVTGTIDPSVVARPPVS